MRKSLLILAAAALSTAAFAQDVPTGECYIINKANGLQIASGSWWGTRGLLKESGLPVTVEKNGNGTFKLTTPIGNGQIKIDNNHECFVDGSDALEFTISSPNNDGFYTIVNNGEALTWEHPENDHVFLNHDAADAADEKQLWEILSVEQMKERLKDATEANPMNATFLIKAHDLSPYDKTIDEAWIHNPKSAKAGGGYWVEGNNWDKTNVWVFTCDQPETTDTEDVIYQEIEGAPAGTYEYTGFIVNDCGTLNFTINGTKVDVEELDPENNSGWIWSNTARDAYYENKYRPTQKFTVGDDGKILIKMHKINDAVDGDGKTTNNRMAFKDFNFKYFGNGSSGIEGVAIEAVDADAPAEYYNMQGIRVAEPTTGLYIVRQGNKVSKQLIRK